MSHSDNLRDQAPYLARLHAAMAVGGGMSTTTQHYGKQAEAARMAAEPKQKPPKNKKD